MRCCASGETVRKLLEGLAQLPMVTGKTLKARTIVGSGRSLEGGACGRASFLLH